VNSVILGFCKVKWDILFESQCTVHEAVRIFTLISSGPYMEILEQPKQVSILNLIVQLYVH